MSKRNGHVRSLEKKKLEVRPATTKRFALASQVETLKEDRPIVVILTHSILHHLSKRPSGMPETDCRGVIKQLWKSVDAENVQRQLFECQECRRRISTQPTGPQSWIILNDYAVPALASEKAPPLDGQMEGERGRGRSASTI